MKKLLSLALALSIIASPSFGQEIKAGEWRHEYQVAQLDDAALSVIVGRRGAWVMVQGKHGWQALNIDKKEARAVSDHLDKLEANNIPWGDQKNAGGVNVHFHGKDQPTLSLANNRSEIVSMNMDSIGRIGRAFHSAADRCDAAQFYKQGVVQAGGVYVHTVAQTKGGSGVDLLVQAVKSGDGVGVRVVRWQDYTAGGQTIPIRDYDELAAFMRGSAKAQRDMAKGGETLRESTIGGVPVAIEITDAGGIIHLGKSDGSWIVSLGRSDVSFAMKGIKRAERALKNIDKAVTVK